MDRKNFEHIMCLHASPMLAGLRAATLLSFRKSKYNDFDGMLASYEKSFAGKGISILRVTEGKEYVLILFYRAAALARLLASSQAEEMLDACGYGSGTSLAEKLQHLQIRMQLRNSFPHEIGLFLGYPPEDVKGFIDHKGRDFAYSGYWKVYDNADKTVALFNVYSACTNDYCNRLNAGQSLVNLLVAI